MAIPYVKSAKWIWTATVGTLATIFGLWSHPSAAETKAQQLAFLYADAFSDSSLATAGQTVVFESDSADNVVRIELQEGAHRLCLNSSGEYFSGIVLDESTPVLDPQGCTIVNGRSEFYRIGLSHAADKPAVREVALLSIDRSGVPLVTSNGDMRKGYWALTQWISTGRTEEVRGRLRAVPTPDGRMPVVADMASSQMDSYSLWQFARSAVLLADLKSVFSFDPDAFGNSVKGTMFVAHGGEGPLLRATGNSDRFRLRVDNNDGSPGAELGFAPTLFAPQTLKAIGTSPHSRNAVIFSLVFRFFPDAADLDSLTQGEAALYQSADYQGRAAVFPASVQNLPALSDSTTALDHGPVSIRVGPGTEATLYTGENYSGVATRIHANVPLLTGTGGTASIRLTPLVARLLANRSCVECNFDGVDLSGLDLTRFDLTGVRLTGANLTNTRLNGAQLKKADLSGATLSCADFSGADASHRNDLTSTDFSNIRLVHNNSCRSNFSYTVITRGSLSRQMLADVNLTGAIIRTAGRSLQSTPVPPPNLTSGSIDVNGQPIALPKGGYWAIQPDPAQDPQHRPGRLRLQLPFRHYGIVSPNTARIAVDYSSQQMDALSLFQIINYQHLDTNAILGPPANTFFDWTEGEESVLGVGSNYSPTGSILFPIEVIDLGGYRFTFGVLDFVDGQSLPLYKTSDGFLTNNYEDSPSPSLELRVLFRYYPDGAQIGVLQQGEIALFQEQNFKGKAAVFAPGSDPIDLTETNSPETTIDKTAVSIRVGNNTALIWTSALTKKGVALLSAATGDDHRLKEWGLPTGPITTIAATEVLVGDQYSFDCSGCQMTGVDLSGTTQNPLRLTNKFLYDADFSKATFSNVDFSWSTLRTGHFDNATLSNVSFVNAQLQQTSFAGATLSCVDFHGADPEHLADLTQAIFTNAKWVTTNNCVNDLSFTKLSVAQLPPSTWSSLKLTGAFFVDATGRTLSSKAQPLHLENAKLAGISLQGAILDYAVLTGADLTGAFLSNSSLQGANLVNAKLNGAALVNVNFDGANLGSAYLTKPSPSGEAANLEGAFLRNVNLSHARLSGAKFTNANFYSTSPVGTFTCAVHAQGFTHGCATAAGAVMEDTEFGGAYLYGTDFTNSTIQGTHFGNSFLTGANFAGATLSSDRSGTEVGFSGAFLQGTNFGGATLQNGVSMDGAFVDFGTGGSGSFGNAIYLNLSGQHTSFPGYWNTPGDQVCVKMTYSNPTIVPRTGPNDTCPSGSSYPTGCGAATRDGSNTAWKSHTDITSMASYMNNATYTNAPSNGQRFCAEDLKWKPFGINNARLGKSTAFTPSDEPERHQQGENR